MPVKADLQREVQGRALRVDNRPALECNSMRVFSHENARNMMIKSSIEFNAERYSANGARRDHRRQCMHECTSRTCLNPRLRAVGLDKAIHTKFTED